jgi:hypothetical protein
MLGHNRGLAVDRTRSDPTHLHNSTKAEDAIVLWCDVTGKANDCPVVTSGLGRLSIAAGSDGKLLAARQAFTQAAADAAAPDGAGPDRRSA